MSTRLPVLWDADPHTIAKIAILKGYLNAWFRVLGKSRKNQVIFYIDGFAGPGRYRNHPEGSPIAVLKAAEGAIRSLGADFIASRLHCAFIETHRERFKVLSAPSRLMKEIPKSQLRRKTANSVTA
jgi:three-Cys-motif partner protein